MSILRGVLYTLYRHCFLDMLMLVSGHGVHHLLVCNAVFLSPRRLHFRPCFAHLRGPNFKRASNQARASRQGCFTRSRRADSRLQSRSNFYLSRVRLSRRNCKGVEHPTGIRHTCVQRSRRGRERPRLQLPLRPFSCRARDEDAAHHWLRGHTHSHI